MPAAVNRFRRASDRLVADDPVDRAIVEADAVDHRIGKIEGAAGDILDQGTGCGLAGLVLIVGVAHLNGELAMNADTVAMTGHENTSGMWERLLGEAARRVKESGDLTAITGRPTSGACVTT